MKSSFQGTIFVLLLLVLLVSVIACSNQTTVTVTAAPTPTPTLSNTEEILKTAERYTIYATSLAREMSNNQESDVTRYWLNQYKNGITVNQTDISYGQRAGEGLVRYGLPQIQENFAVVRVKIIGLIISDSYFDILLAHDPYIGNGYRIEWTVRSTTRVN